MYVLTSAQRRGDAIKRRNLLLKELRRRRLWRKRSFRNKRRRDNGFNLGGLSLPLLDSIRDVVQSTVRSAVPNSSGLDQNVSIDISGKTALKRPFLDNSGRNVVDDQKRYRSRKLKYGVGIHGFDVNSGISRTEAFVASKLRKGAKMGSLIVEDLSRGYNIPLAGKGLSQENVRWRIRAPGDSAPQWVSIGSDIHRKYQWLLGDGSDVPAEVGTKRYDFVYDSGNLRLRNGPAVFAHRVPHNQLHRPVEPIDRSHLSPVLADLVAIVMTKEPIVPSYVDDETEREIFDVPGVSYVEISPADVDEANVVQYPPHN